MPRFSSKRESAPELSTQGGGARQGRGPVSATWARCAPRRSGVAPEHGLARLAALFDVLGDRLELLFLGLVDEIFGVDALDAAVGRDDRHVQAVDLLELGGLGVGRTGHARELLVEAEQVLERD